MSIITEGLINTLFDYSLLGIAVAVFGFLTWQRFQYLEKQVKILTQIVVLQSAAMSEIKGFVVASDKFDTTEKDNFLKVLESLNTKVAEIYEKEKNS